MRLLQITWKIKRFSDNTGGRGQAGFLTYDVPAKEGYSMLRFNTNTDTGAPLNPLKNENGYQGAR